MKKFEYKLLEYERGLFSGIDFQQLSNQLNQLGAKGWEAVSTTSLSAAGQTTSVLITLKREID